MNIIIPLGGKGERFYKEGYTNPKPLIHIFHKEMIFHVLDNLHFSKEDQIFIVYYVELDKYHFSNIIKNKYSEINFILVHYQTSGAVETIHNANSSELRSSESGGFPPQAELATVNTPISMIKTISNHKKTILLDCDTFYTMDILTIARNINQNAVFYKKTENEKPIYSYILLNEQGKIVSIKEKEKISSNANTGAYLFHNIEELEYYCKYVLDNKITFNGEPYTSCVISEMIKTQEFYGIELEKKTVFSVGTPTELQDFVKDSYVFLFDLDGTIVNTDGIYFNVWKEICKQYNIHLTNELFYKYIHGNTDTIVLQQLLPNANIHKISKLKDELFVQQLTDIKIIEGVCDFMKKLKYNGYFCSIVTNCNRCIAEKIINYCDISQYIDFIIVGNECDKPKPFAEPYIEAMKKYNIKSNKSIIFEDSKSGLLSASGSSPLCIVGITTKYNEHDLQIYGANIVIDNYNNIDIDTLKMHNSLTKNRIKSYICNSINLDIIDIIIDDEKLKGGFISDVLALKIITKDSILPCVLKLENKNETKLSIMAKKLGLYERENYFYDTISKDINIQFPKFMGLIKDNHMDTIGILMENLHHKKFELNVNLNSKSIDISLKIIEKMAKLHAKFWNKCLEKKYPELKKHNDPLFCPVWQEFIIEKYPIFIDNWKNILTEAQIEMAEKIVHNFDKIQERLSNNNLTIIHGDIKSPNIFYDTQNNYEPYFLDWQYIANGKGVQDFIFFLIESFDIDKIKMIYPIFKHYYYMKLMEHGVQYSFSEYEQDICDALCYFPFFVSIWFGTTPQDELIDKNFPFFFIQKVFHCIEYIYQA